MAYRRSITARAKHFYQQQQRAAAPFPQIHRGDSDREELHIKSVSRDTEISSFIQHRFYGTGNNFSNFHGSRNAFQDRRLAMPSSCGLVFGRNFSSTGVGEGASDNILNDVVGVVGEKAVEVAPVVNEVAVAAADSPFPVAAVQYLIDYVHCFTGFSWWASIAATTLLLSTLHIPFLINNERKTATQNYGMSSIHTLSALLRGMSPTEGLGHLVSSSIHFSFFFAIVNMAEKVPSFKEGGILWFTDLTTCDSMFIFPVLMALTIRAMLEVFMVEGLPNSRTNKSVLAALFIPITASIPKAVFCYWITYNLFRVAIGLTMRKPEVKKFLGFPNLPPSPPQSATKN